MNERISNKTPLFVSLILIGVLILLVCLSKNSGHKDPEPAPTLPPVEEPEPSEPSSPHEPAKDYTDGEFAFTDDMGDVVLSHNGYFYNQDITLKIYTRKEAVIYYSMDGSRPVKTSSPYSGEYGIKLTAAKGEEPNVYSVHAVAYYEDGTQSDEIVHTYLLGKGVETRFENLLIFCLSGEPEDFTEPPHGIFYGLNYELRGKESERPVYAEILNRSGSLITAQKLGVRINGGYNRQNSQKSMKLFARKKYSPDEGTAYLNCFDFLAEDGTQIVRYDRFVLRASGNDFRFGFVRDELNMMLAKDAGFEDYEPVFPAVAYLNGKYFGYYWVHGSYCDEFFKRRYGDSPAKKASTDGTYKEGEFVVLDGSELHKKADEGDDEEAALCESFNKDYEKFAAMNLKNDANYKALTAFMDVENYLDYMAYNIYLCNKDWPNNNVRCYRYFAAEGESYGEGPYDGRWRYLLHDIDYTLGLYGQPEVMNSYDTLKHVMTLDGDRRAPLFTALMERADCRAYFIKKSLDYGAGALSYSSISSKLASITKSRTKEMHFYYNYLISLRQPDVAWINENQLEEHLEEILKFAQRRPERSADYLKYDFNLTGTRYNLLINGAGGARVRVNSFLAKEGADIAGVYFTDYATTVSAELALGKAFDYWEVNGKRVDKAVLSITAKDLSDGSVKIVLHVKDEPMKQVFLSGFSSRDEDYVTVCNLTGADVDLNGYVLSDGTYEYRFESGSLLKAGETVTVYGENTKKTGDSIRKAIFNLSEGDVLTLRNAGNVVIDSVTIPNSHTGYVFKRNLFTNKFEERVP